MNCLLSSYGTVVCRDRKTGALLHRPAITGLHEVDVLEIDDASRSLSANFGHFMRDDISALRVTMNRGFLAGWTITRSPDQRSLMLSRNGQWLTADAGTGAIGLTADGTLEAARFLPVSRPDLAVLTEIQTAQWLVQSADTGVPPQYGRLMPGFRLSVGGLDIDLRWNLPFDRSEWPHRLPVLLDGWRIDLICRYRPLIYYAACGSAAFMQQFALSLTSLVTVGDYDGAILVMTDKSAAEIATLVPPGMRATLVVLPTVACDKMAAMAARLTIAGWADAWQFQPLLYVDADVLFDLPVDPMLRAIARSDQICAPVEHKEPLATSIFVGSGLLRADDCDPGEALGFNSGTLGIPNLQRHAGTLDLISRIMFNRVAMFGRDALPYAEQPIANYALFRLKKADTALISPFVRLADHTVQPPDRRGLVHYCWVPDAETRVALMRYYLLGLLELGATRDSDESASVSGVDGNGIDKAALFRWVERIGVEPVEKAG
ncbi:MAG: hypothetical protein ACJ8AW_51090 [Rhodopila sp.]